MPFMLLHMIMHSILILLRGLTDAAHVVSLGVLLIGVSHDGYYRVG